MKFLCVGISFIFINAAVCNSQWVQQQSNTQRHLFGIDLIDANTGFVAGELNTIRKTTNGGLIWLTIIPPMNLDYGRVSFLNVNTGIISAGPGTRMIQTYDGGVTWINRYPVQEPGKVQYIDSTTIYATGAYSVMKSIDGGASWFILDTTVFYGYFRGLFFINRDTGTAVGRQGLIRTTTNGGATWVQRVLYLPVQFGDSTITDVIYVNTLTGYACGNNGIVVKTTNGGVNWTYTPTGVLSYLQGIYFTDANTGTVVGNTGRIMRTTNGGSNWINQSLSSPLNSPLWDVDFVNQDTGWVVGFNGIIVKTTNGGFTWIEPISNNVPSEFKLEQNYPNPFNPVTTIRFAVTANVKSEISNIKLIIFDILGREDATLVNEVLQPGTYEVEWVGSNYPSGIYFYKLVTPEYTETKKMILIR
jgi:photosystem II stability/assembly factor-like uncharacterized protein